MQTYPIQTAPSPLPTTFLRASELGLALNCDLMTGLDKTTGLAAADDGPAINAAMAGASAANPLCLLMDGSSCVSGLKLPTDGHWSIQGYGRDTGFFMKAGSNNHVVHNGPVAINNTLKGFAAPARTSGNGNVTIRDLFINGNRGNGTNGNSTSGDPKGTTAIWYFGICLENLDHIRVENVQCYNISSFNLTFENCGDWVVEGCHFENVLPGATVVSDNSDGIHVFGPCNDGRISNCYFRTGDDAIALNAYEGYGGLITRIAVTNCVGKDILTSLMRIYTDSTPPLGASAQSLVDGVTVTNYQATCSGGQAGFLIGNPDSVAVTVAETITNVTFAHCRVTCSGFAFIQDSVGTMTFDSCDWISGGASPMFMGTSKPAPVSLLNITNCRALRTPAGSGITALLGTGAWFVGGGATVWGRVNINGFVVVDVGGYSGSPVAGLLSLNYGSTLAHLQVDAVDASNIVALLDSGTGVPTAVAGGGVLQTGWEIADTVAAKWTPYVSASSHIPSYRNAAGTVISL